jgi:hypothetical protein
MQQKFVFSDSANHQMIRNRLIEELLKFFGDHKVEHWRNGQLLDIYDIHNDITNQGKNDILNVYFNGGSQTAAASWYIGLVSSTGYTGLAATDVMSSHAGWTEFTSFSQANRVAWGPGAPASQSITNATPAQFDITANGTVKGIFIVTNNTKGGTTGTLWSTALFSADVPVANGKEYCLAA